MIPFFVGNIRTALDMTNELLQLSPNHERAVGNKIYYERELARNSDESSDRKLRGDDGSPELEKSVADAVNSFGRHLHDTPERQLYESLCRNEVKPDPKQQAKLHCRYVTNTSPFLKIAPLKLEEANLKPYIVLYHDVMYDNEIEVLKQMAKPRFRRATVQNHKTGELETANYRISKSAWLRNDEHKFIEDIALRVEDMTGLTTSTAEELQVVNYGIGGHYEPHFDFARKEEKNAFKSLGTGNRIATVLFYVSQPHSKIVISDPMQANLVSPPKDERCASGGRYRIPSRPTRTLAKERHGRFLVQFARVQRRRLSDAACSVSRSGRFEMG